MSRKRKWSLILLIPIFIFTTTFTPAAESRDDEALYLTIEEAVKLGLENSIDLRLVQNEIDMSKLDKDIADHSADKLEDGDERLDEGKDMLSVAREVESSVEQIEQAVGADGSLPEDLTIPGIGTFPQGMPLSQVKETLKQKGLDSSAIQQKLISGEQSLTNALQMAGETLSNKLNFDTLDALGVKSTSNLMTTMADVAYEVTKYSYDIYRNKIAMLIQKNYYDVLKAQKILEVKEKAMERGKKQFDFSKASYEEGMKAKDEMLLAQAYYKSTQIEYMKAKGDLENALIEFKKSINIPLDTKVVLTDVFADDREIVDLQDGLKSGLKNRLEIKKALGEVGVYDLNFEITRKRYPDITFMYREAKLLKEKARINYEKTYLEVENSIRQSYETLMTTGEMLEMAKGMVEGVKESVEIAEYKYKEGFGVETSLLKKLDLESSAGTIVEVLAAEEKLAEVEEKVVEITYGYNLAKMKYYNDIGKFIY